MRIMMIGDIVGKPGRQAVRLALPELVAHHQVDLVVANGENAAGGLGITPKIAAQLFQQGIDVITLGNHAWQHREIYPYLDEEERMVRPANFPDGTPGRGWHVYAAGTTRVGVVNLQGQIFLQQSLANPFHAADRILAQVQPQTRVILVDFHAEATSEKAALGWYLDGRCSAVIGTHTHVQTADARLLPGGTAYMTDVGMTGPRDSVIGVRSRQVIERFRTQLPNRFEVAASGPLQFNAVLLEIADETGTARAIHPIFIADVEASLAGGSLTGQ